VTRRRTIRDDVDVENDSEDDGLAEAAGHAADVIDAGPLGVLVLVAAAPIVWLVRRLLHRSVKHS
jgi:hypothetical protein